MTAGRKAPPYTAWLAHLYTASGAVFAFIATRAIFEYRFRDAFFWLGITIIINATDGTLARAARAAARLPWFNGAKLDELVDYVTYVFVPVVLVWRAQLVPDSWIIAVAAAILISSGYGFSRVDAKTEDHFFTGFPSYWNLASFYLFLMHLSQAGNAVLLLALSVMVFVPIRYLYPSRMPRFRAVTNALGAAWGVALLVMIWQLPAISPVLLWGSLAYPVYYVAMSLYI